MYINCIILWLKRKEKSNTYLTHVCRLLQSLERLERIEKSELSAGTVAFISCRLCQVGVASFSPT